MYINYIQENVIFKSIFKKKSKKSIYYNIQYYFWAH
jgi:hypothetical protein